MKRFKNYLMYVAVLAMLMISCSKDEIDSIPTDEPEMATLNFGVVLNDLMDQQSLTRQAMTFPDCSDQVPSYVQVVLSGTTAVGSYEDPIEVGVNPNPGDFDDDGTEEYFTLESSDLELEAGPYSLDFFAVYDEDDNLIWLAPYGESDYIDWVSTPLPMDFDLGAGTKKYLDVEVLCFDDRTVNEFGYLFFDLHPTQAIEFCIFGNYCDDDGRHYPAEYSVNIWSGNDDTGEVLYSDLQNTVEMDNNGDYSGSTVCVALPDIGGEDTVDHYYVEITLLNSDAYGDVTEEVIRSFTLTDAQVRTLFDGEDAIDYWHFREGVGCATDSPTFTDNGTPPVIDVDTNIYIYFDSSGSMNSTLSPLQTMRNTLLKDALIGLYDNDEDAYNDKVRVISDGSERTLNMLNFQGETPAGNVISLVFQDEAEYIYHSGGAWDENTTRTGTYELDVDALRTRLNSFPSGYYRGVIFQVETDTWGPFANFKSLIEYIENGTGNYAGNYGLSDRIEFGYNYGVTPGATPTYYADLIVQALEDLGYQL
ncbi:MAG: hypothetical protein ACQEWD_12835 [Bacteroidota bacterium]